MSLFFGLLLFSDHFLSDHHSSSSRYAACQDLKPSNVAVNEDCELRVSASAPAGASFAHLNSPLKTKPVLPPCRSWILGWPDRRTTR